MMKMIKMTSGHHFNHKGICPHKPVNGIIAIIVRHRHAWGNHQMWYESLTAIPTKVSQFLSQLLIKVDEMFLWCTSSMSMLVV